MRSAKKGHVLAIVAGLTMTVGSGSINADQGGNWRTVHFTATDTGGTMKFLDPTCDVAGNCIYVTKVSGNALGGDLDGTEVSTGLATVAPTGVVVLQTSAAFSGSVRGCGTGTVVYTNHGVLMPDEQIFRFTLRIEPGTGTGDFAGMTGSGLGEIDLADPAGVATVTGKLRCQRVP
jgi:hypothetical protein